MEHVIDPAVEEVLISDLYVQCSLRIHNFEKHGIAMSDCCRQTARSGVVDPITNITLWRCIAHEGMLDFRTGDKGEIVYVIKRRSK